jgi:hypothetical protein
MRRPSTLVLVAATVAVLALGLGPAAIAAQPTLYANYSTNCTFGFVTDSGSPVASLPPGTYQIVVATPFAFSNGSASCDQIAFDLTGPGVNLTTDLGSGDAEYEQHTVTLQPGGTYIVQDDARPGQTRRTFTVATSGSAAQVGSSASSSSSGSSSGSTKGAGTAAKDLVGSAVGTLDALVAPSGKLTLEKAKRSVSIIKSGRYTFRIVDRSKKAGFAVQTVKHTPTTLSTPKFTGARSVTVTLAAGQWYFLTPGGTRHPFIVTK